MESLPPPTEPDPASVSQAIADLYKRFYPMVWGILGRAGIRREADRSDLAHDTFIVAQQLYAKRDRAAPIAAWLAAITWNVVRNYRRLKQETLMDVPEAVATTPSPEDDVIRRRFLLDLLEGLDDERRMVFDMHEIEGFEAPEIARALGKSEGTIRTRLRLAREHVQANVTRLNARAARAEGARAAFPALLPFGAGAWRSLGQSFEDVPPGVEQRVWRAICRTIASGGAAGQAAAIVGSAVAGKVAGALLGTGAVIGGGAVFLMLRALAPASPPARSIGPEVVATAPGMATAAGSERPPEGPEPGTAASAVVAVSARASASPAVGGTVSTIDPEEQRLIAQAQTAVGRREYAAARGALAEHAARFPRGGLVTERKRLLSQIPADMGPATSGATPSPSAPATGSAPHRAFGIDD